MADTVLRQNGIPGDRRYVHLYYTLKSSAVGVSQR
jgi:hypothetical protein